MTSENRSTPEGFTVWVESMLAGTGWSAATISQVGQRGGDDLAASAMADGFAAAERGLGHDGSVR